MVKITPFRRTFYAEADQTHIVQFAWMKEINNAHYTMQHWWVNCRDFLGDALLAKRKNKYIDIYSFCINPDDFEETNLLGIRFETKTKRDAFLKNLSALQKIEANNGIQETELVAVNKLRLIIDVPKFWTHSNITLSLYTYLIKVFSLPGENPWENLDGPEATYYLSVEPVFQKLLNNLGKLKFPKLEDQYDSCENLTNFHNNSGFVSYFKTNTSYDLRKELIRL